MPTATAQWITLGFVVAVTTLVIGYDILAIRWWGFDASISRVARRLFDASPTLCAAVLVWIGILIGHIGLPTR